MKKLLLFLLALPLAAQNVTLSLACPACPANLVGGGTYNLALNYFPDGGPQISAALIRLGVPVDVQSFVITAGPIATAASKTLSQSGPVAFVIGAPSPLNNGPMQNIGGGVLMNIAVTMKATLTQSSQVFGLPLASAANTSGSNVPVTPAGLTLPSTVVVTPPPPPPPPPPPTGSKCDKNGDGSISVADLTLLDTWVMAAAQPVPILNAACDSNADSKCDPMDSVIILLSVMDPTHACLAK